MSKDMFDDDPNLGPEAKRQLKKFYTELGVPINREVAIAREKMDFAQKALDICSKYEALVDFIRDHLQFSVENDFVHLIPLESIELALRKFLDSETSQKPNSIRVAQIILEELKNKNLGPADFVEKFCSCFTKSKDYLEVCRDFGRNEITALTMYFANRIDFTSVEVVWEILSKLSKAKTPLMRQDVSLRMR